MGPAQRDWGPYKRGRLEADRLREEGREDEGGRLQGQREAGAGPPGTCPMSVSVGDFWLPKPRAGQNVGSPLRGSTFLPQRN